MSSHLKHASHGEERSFASVGAGNVVEEMRLAAGITVQEIAARAGLSEKKVRTLENAVGAESPNVADLARVAKACGFDLLLVASSAGEPQKNEVISARLSVVEKD